MKVKVLVEILDMIDQFGRNIEYMRISITDRCNLRCIYCMPDGIETVDKSYILRNEEIIRICKIAVSLGIKRFKITGGEPLVRANCIGLIEELSSIEGVEDITITSNGILLKDNLIPLKKAGVSSINISIDSLDENTFSQITGGDASLVYDLKDVVLESVKLGFKTKINTVLLKRSFEYIDSLLAIVEENPVDIRFIELMPIGFGKSQKGIDSKEALDYLTKKYPDLKPVNEKRGNGPAHYYSTEYAVGRIGFIEAISNRFCDNCNRVRLTSMGFLKSCLCFDEGCDIKTPLRAGADDEFLEKLMRDTIYKKPIAHCFHDDLEITEIKTMSQIGG